MQPFEDIDPRCMVGQGTARVSWTTMGIWTASHLPERDRVLRPTTSSPLPISTSGRQILRTYNDFLVDIQQESNERLIPQAILPVWDMDFTVAEMTRLLDKGIRGSRCRTSLS